MIEKRNIFISIQEKREMNNSFFNSICAYTFRCAKNCSKQQFKDIMDDVLNNVKVMEIIYNCNMKSDNFSRKFEKFLVQKKLLNMCWFLVRFKKQIRKLYMLMSKDR